jgi:hypothetical protein
VSAVSASSQSCGASTVSVPQKAAADYIGEVVFELAAVAAVSGMPLIHYLLCMVLAETHNITRHMEAADVSSGEEGAD